MPTLLNVRLGFANNSSSSHSIVFLRNTNRAEELDTDPDNYEFGWDEFTASSKRTKENYLIATVGAQLKDLVGDNTARIVLGHLFGRSTSDMRLDGYVDHQSALIIPEDFHGRSIDIEYFNELSAVLLRDDVAVLGGNDNEENTHPLSSDTAGRALSVPDDSYSNGWVARKDGSTWAFFHRPTGNKIRFSFEDNVVYEKSSLPELVDVKITDYCPYGCEFCYQGSTTAGKHAERWSIRGYAALLGENKVFEAAIGGGEPTLHPDFIEILRDFRECGVVPNFTTRNLAWLRGENRDEILRLCGSFAVSTERAEDVSKLAHALDYHGIDHNKVTLQFIAGASDKWRFRRLIEAAIQHRLNYTILGYKDTGRGASFRPAATVDECWAVLMDVLAEQAYMRVGIDTVFAEQIKGRLQDTGVNEVFYHVKDGTFSCYIDAVEKTIAPSSYCDKNKFKPLVLNHQDSSEFRRIYSSFA